MIMSAPLSSPQLESARASSLNCRLLWRGSFTIAELESKRLDGIAIVAHQFSSQLSPFDDPFSPISISQAADIGLGLEMIRGAQIPVRGIIKTWQAGGERQRSEGMVEVETPTDLRVYVDQRCLATARWFEKTFCTEETIGDGIRLEVGGEEFIIFAAYPGPNSSPSTSTLPPLKLLLGRVVLPKVRRPRPDDPLPRESLFAKKLRRTTSMPALNLTNSKVKSSKVTKLSTSNSLPNILTKKTSKATKLKVAQSISELMSRDKGKGKAIEVIPSSRAGSMEDPFDSILVPSAAIGLSGPKGAKRSLKRSRTEDFDSRKVMKVEEEVVERFDYLPGSPTPSVTGTVNGDEEDEDESKDVVKDLPNFAFSRASSNHLNSMEAEDITSSTDLSGSGPGVKEIVRKEKGMKRSNSAPVGLFLQPNASEAISRSRSESIGVDGFEAKNKATIRKILLAAMISAGVQRKDESFNEIFSISLKGVQFALRSCIKVMAIDRLSTSEIIQTHLSMYLLPPKNSEPLSSLHIDAMMEE